MSIDDCRLIQLPKIQDSRGSLSFVQNDSELGFDIQRLYYIYDVPGGERRGAHAHKKLRQLMIAMSGSFEVELSDGCKSTTYFLNKPYIGLYICPRIWRDLKNFSSGAVCAVLASENFDEEDYIRDYDDFCSLVGVD